MKWTHLTIARIVQRRLRRRKVYVHNVLVRGVVCEILDLLTEMPPRASHRLLDRFMSAGRPTSPLSRPRAVRILKVAYSERIMQERGTRFWAHLRRYRGYDPLTDEEIAAMQMLRRRLHFEGDACGVRAVDKTLLYLRP